jgi:hypothetical protein
MLRGVIQLSKDEILSLFPNCKDGDDLLHSKLQAAIDQETMQVEISVEEAERMLDCIDIEEIAADPTLQSAQQKLSSFIAKLRDIKTEVN